MILYRWWYSFKFYFILNWHIIVYVCGVIEKWCFDTHIVCIMIKSEQLAYPWLCNYMLFKYHITSGEAVYHNWLSHFSDAPIDHKFYMVAAWLLYYEVPHQLFSLFQSLKKTIIYSKHNIRIVYFLWNIFGFLALYFAVQIYL